MSGITTTGFQRKILDEILTDIATQQRARISSSLDVSERTVVGNLNAIFADHISQAWEVLEEAYSAFDPDNASDDRLVALALLSGVERQDAQTGLVTATVVTGAAFTGAAAGGLVAHVVDEPENRWVNRDAVAAGAGTRSVVFESEEAGAGAIAAAATLTVIAGPVSGWTSITNPADATSGTDQETIEDLRARREASLALAGSGTVDAIRADVLAVDGVEQVKVNENTTDATVGGIPPHAFEVIVWDGSPGAALDDDLAQAIYDTRPAGIVAHGSLTGNAVTSDGQVVAVAFSRATEVPIYAVVEIESALGVAIADVKAAIAAAMPTLVGGDVVYNRMSGSVFNVDGVDNFVSFTVGIAPSPVGTSNIAITDAQIATLDLTNISVSGDVS
jgi:uncharacterized phage protein gp47/JayE